MPHTPEELEDYKRFVLNLVGRVANAHREDGESVRPGRARRARGDCSELGSAGCLSLFGD
jgi:hypothetical protein